MTRYRLPLAWLVAAIIIAEISCSAGATERPFTEHELNILKVSEGIIRLFEQHAMEIWPGFDLSKRPFLVYVPEHWALIFNCPHNVEGFSPYPDDWPDLGAPALYHHGTYRNLVGQLAFNFEIDSVVTCAVGLPEKFTESFENPTLSAFSYIVHEEFHQYQRGSFGEIQWAREERYPIQDVENSSLAYLEMAVLVDALTAMKTDDREKCLELIGLFIALRNQRWSLSGPFVEKYEQGQEINEGTAKYIELKSVDLMTGLKYESSLHGLTKPLIESFSTISMPDFLIDIFQKYMDNGCVSPEDVIRNRIYPVGSAQGFLLDYLGIDWKGMAQEAGPYITFAGLFQERLGIRENRFDELVAEAKRIYDYETILRATSRSIEAFNAGYEKELSAFHKQRGYQFEVDFFYRSIKRSRLSKSKKWVVDKGTYTLCSFFAVYTLENKDLSLQVHDAAVMEKNDWDNKRKTVICYVSDLDTIEIDGQAARLEEDVQYGFKSIRLLCENLDFQSEKPGTITRSSSGIRISLAQ